MSPDPNPDRTVDRNPTPTSTPTPTGARVLAVIAATWLLCVAVPLQVVVPRLDAAKLTPAVVGGLMTAAGGVSAFVLALLLLVPLGARRK